MEEWIVYFVAGVLTLPILYLIIVYFIARKLSHHKRKAVHLTASFSAPVFITAVHLLIIVLFNQSFLPYIIIFLLVLLGTSMIVQYKIHEELKFLRAWKGFCRVSFLLFALCYIGLSSYGLIIHIFT